MNPDSWCSRGNTVSEFTLETLKIENSNLTSQTKDYYYATTTESQTNFGNSSNYEEDSAETEQPPMKKYFMKNGFLRIDRDYYRTDEFCIKGLAFIFPVFN